MKIKADANPEPRYDLAGNAVSNRILCVISVEEFQNLQPALEFVELPQRRFILLSAATIRQWASDPTHFCVALRLSHNGGKNLVCAANIAFRESRMPKYIFRWKTHYFYAPSHMP